MKKEFSIRPKKITEPWNAWQNFLTAMPSLVFVVTGWKSNGKENACLQSWSSFMGSAPAWRGTDDFFCIMPVSKGGHMYQIDNPTNPETGERTPDIGVGTLEINDPIPWNIK